MEERQHVHMIICEGTSEAVYLQELNRFLREEEIPLVYIPISSNGGQYSKVVKTYKTARKNNPRTPIHICLDYDIYLRNNDGNWASYVNRPKSIPEFLFTHMNFEDFLTLHLEKELSEKWYCLCKSRQHFSSPMHADTYVPLFAENIIPFYTKGEMPFVLTIKHLKNLFSNLNGAHAAFPCGFAQLFQQHLKDLARADILLLS
ncbi:hypothetical protein [Sphaerochaeta sp. PS]|uniref:hypothetical protein n=1 Tax=Sphaerochaeta sp. PS TaxID=3076336 RepID=UPI0028A54B21|nr:hypothetical protein [Sphaerochaeta sp. PS]MDT4763191.1 hypothetical protein [Sphaerochaeta sp. PS]